MGSTQRDDVIDLMRENAALRKRVEELTEVVRGLSPSSTERDAIATEVCPGVDESVLDAVRRKIRELMDSRKRVEELEGEARKLQADLDAALKWIEGYTDGPSGPGNTSQRVLALLEKRRGGWICPSCGHTEQREREVRCWKCGNGEMQRKEERRG